MTIKTLLMAGLLALSGNVSAALITLDGDGFNVVYDDASLGLFGSPTLSGDGKTILFSPLAFKATSSGAQGFVSVGSNVQFDILLDDGANQLNGVQLIENGDYRVVNAGNLSDVPEVNVSGELRLTNLFTGTEFVQQAFTAGSLSNTCSSVTNCTLSPWTVNSSASADDAWGAVDVRVRLQNDLLAASFESRDFAEIEKKHASQTISLTPTFVPLPGAVWLFGSALAGLMGMRRKNKVHALMAA
jgi:hypothetical protein